MAQQTTGYDNVPVYTGQYLPQDNSGFFQPPAPQAEGLMASDQARAVAEVQAALVIAASRPRNELRARDRLLQACQREGLAAGALYQYNRGGGDVTGPSIRLAEAAARAWGNMTYGFRELSRSLGVSECEAYAWDLETNTKAVRQFTVRHKRDVGGGSKDVKTERDIYEVIANNAQRRVRAAILEIIPGDIIEDAVAECKKTQHATVGNVSEAAEKLLIAFKDIGVSREAVEKRLGQRIDSIRPAQIIAFRKIYASIRDGMSEPEDWFELEGLKPAEAKTDPTPEAAPEPPTQAPKKAVPPKQPPKQAAMPEPPMAEPGQDPFPQFTVKCPNKDGKPVDEMDCAGCRDRRNCPEWPEE